MAVTKEVPGVEVAFAPGSQAEMGYNYGRIPHYNLQEIRDFRITFKPSVMVAVHEHMRTIHSIYYLSVYLFPVERAEVEITTMKGNTASGYNTVEVVYDGLIHLLNICKWTITVPQNISMVEVLVRSEEDVCLPWVQFVSH